MRDAARIEVTERERRSEERGLRVRTRSGELADELRTAAMEGDRRLVRQLVAELLGLPRVPGHSRVGLQLPALIGLIESLRAVALSDELTGLCNRRGFMQIGVRFLEVARREGRAVQLLYFDLNNLKQVNDSMGHAAGDLLLRETGDLLRALFPDYGVHEVLGRLGGDEFAALTTRPDQARRAAMVVGACRTQRPYANAPLSLSVGAAQFDPQRPMEIGELLEVAERAMYDHKRVARVPSAELFAQSA
jgi:diguanylate cyclase (GGDEF)-like protein